MKKLTLEEFIIRCKFKHGEIYDYSQTEYINTFNNVKIICKVHGAFNQLPGVHLKGSGCQKCAANKVSLGINEFIIKANLIHNYKYDYSNVNYINNNTNISIFCKDHGIFYTTPNSHLSKKIGCHKCSKQERYTTKSFIDKANSIHKNYYTYDKVVFKSIKHKIIITCPIHGDFKQDPHNHLKGYNCIKCSGFYMDKETFIEKCNKIHNNKYGYNNVIYKNQNTKIDILCYKHGMFSQIPSSHLHGKSGCPRCKSSIGENLIENILIENKLIYKKQYTFKNLKYKKLLKFDFGILENNKLKYLIEYNGIQHYEFVEFIHKYESKFYESKIRDEMKIEFCLKNNIKLYIIKYNESIFDKLKKIINL